VTAPLDIPEAPRGPGRMRRVVCRFGDAHIARIDAFRLRFPKARSRAATIRALSLMGLAAAEQASKQAPEVTP
jgi:hypothetical protein